jgi:hypothetical protein
MISWRTKIHILTRAQELYFNEYSVDTSLVRTFMLQWFLAEIEFLRYLPSIVRRQYFIMIFFEKSAHYSRKNTVTHQAYTYNNNNEYTLTVMVSLRTRWHILTRAWRSIKLSTFSNLTNSLWTFVFMDLARNSNKCSACNNQMGR